MHSSRMRTARSLTVSHRKTTHTPPGATKPPRATMHAPPEQPCMPSPLGATTHTPQATMHAPLEQPCMPPQSSHACPPGSNHTCPPEQPHMSPPGATTHAPLPPCGQTDTCKNITFANFVCGR